MGNSGRKGFTLTSETMLKVLGAILLGGFLFVLAGNELVPIIDDVARSLGFSPYEEGAINAGKAMSYAVSCTALIHSSENCGSGGLTSNEQSMCTEMEDMWNNGPTTSMPHGASASDERYYKVGKTCSQATKGQGAQFGRISVECDEFDDPGGTCDIHNFALPQRLGSSGELNNQASVLQAGKNYLIGRGTPKYLLYYEAMDESFMKDWESRLESQSLFAFASGAIITGLTVAVIPAGAFAARHTAGGRAMRYASKQIPNFRTHISTFFSQLADRWRNFARSALPSRIQDSIDDIAPGGSGNTAADALDEIADEIGRIAGGWRAGLASMRSTLRNFRRGTVDEHNWELLMRSRLSQEYDRSIPLPAGGSTINIGDVDQVFWEGEGNLVTESFDSNVKGLRHAFVEGRSDMGGRTVPEMIEAGKRGDAQEAIARSLREFSDELDARSSGMSDNIKNALFGSPAEPNIQDMASDMADDVYAARKGLRNIVDDSNTLTDDFYFALSARNNAKFQEIVELIEDGNRGAAYDEVESLVRQSDEALDELDDEATSQLMTKVDASLCGSRSSTAEFAAAITAQNIVQDVTDQEDVEARALASTLPALPTSYSAIRPAISDACDGGASALAAIASVENVAVTYVIATTVASTAAAIKRQIPRQPQGINSINVQRGGLFRADWSPIKFPLNKYANWWYVRNEGTGGIGSHSARLQLASPCYPIRQDEGSEQEIEVHRTKVAATMFPMSTGGILSFVPAFGNVASISNSSSPLSLNGYDWSDMVQGSYGFRYTGSLDIPVIDAPWWTGGGGTKWWLMYTQYPLARPSVPHSGTWFSAPPGYSHNNDPGDKFGNLMKIRGAEDPYFEESGFGAFNKPNWFNQTGNWVVTPSNTVMDIPQRYITHHGTGIKQLTPRDFSDKLNFNWYDKAYEWDADVLATRFVNTKFGHNNVPQGANYCYPHPDWDAAAGKIGVFLVAFTAELILDGTILVTGGVAGPVSIPLQFGVGVLEYIGSYVVEQTFGQRWPL